jgi:uncharacterized protein YdeI (YjbR/CyaY-like superfamily)
MIKTEDFTKIEVTTNAQLRQWLMQNYQQSESVWLVTFKKHVRGKYVSTSQLLDEVLCFGWVDGLRRKLDEDRTMQLISPRKTQHWARTYKIRAQRLIQNGQMQESGFLSIEGSKQAGLWDFMNEVDDLKIPDDLAARMNEYQDTAQQFAALAVSYRRNVLRWLISAKKPVTREKRVAQITVSTAKKERIPQM